MVFRFRFALAILFALAAAPIARADVLDQEWAPEFGNSTGFIWGGRAKAQSFTVGVSGRLTRIDARIRSIDPSQDPLTMTIYNTDEDGFPDEALGSVSLPVDQIPMVTLDPIAEFVTYDLTTLAIDVQADEIMAFGMSTTSPRNYHIQGGNNIVDGVITDYPLGMRFSQRDESSDWEMSLGADYALRTFVEPIPEPSSSLLMFVMLCVAIVVRCLKKGPLTMNRKCDHFYLLEEGVKP